MLKEMIDQHVIKSCPKSKPGVKDDQEVDPRPYHDMVQRNADKLKKKSSHVIIEDEYVKPNDFRDPGSRKKEPSNDDLKKKERSVDSKKRDTSLGD